MIINAEHLIVGRLATYTAKKALLGESIDIVNCDKAIITGKKEEILARYKQRRERGDPHHGPYFPRVSDKLVRRVIRGMLPYKQYKGKEAFKRVKCYRGIPENLQGKKLETIKEANVSKMQNLKYISVGEICSFLGGK